MCADWDPRHLRLSCVWSDELQPDFSGCENSAWSSTWSRRSMGLGPCPQHRPLHPSPPFLLAQWLPLAPGVSARPYVLLGRCRPPLQISELAGDIWNQHRVAHGHLPPGRPAAPRPAPLRHVPQHFSSSFHFLLIYALIPCKLWACFFTGLISKQSLSLLYVLFPGDAASVWACDCWSLCVGCVCCSSHFWSNCGSDPTQCLTLL